MTILHNYWQPLAALYQSHADTTIASEAKTYVRNQFDFFGIKEPFEFVTQNPLSNLSKKEALKHFN
ncbi:MAG: hypothetical protein CVT92_06275 [Bacteroidetes bacterium HGW-Bacteroidetes-1]|jgi:3-methyladenine DNA glycosylase AlkD|nr:MAG: hypothetical protein CVT92_06275 [Bacteroidetes bacterium HGW-Bacteroidetes-1]